ncbi:cation:proton antiporter [Halobaculum lipolyticum]|uniref:Cation:proton antiporter n=1 Tax=Halobaculum lipolyticum TaxID=3032001 RepID=A0ABD5WB22_9EURY|nr:sodium:proton antiporter [Halobaculum sp. DT31]
MGGVESQLIGVLYLFAIAAVVGVVAARYARVQYTTGLLVAGLAVSVLGSPVEVTITSEVILLVILPALIFDDAIGIDVEAFRENLVPVLALAVVGMLVSVAVVAVVGQVVFGFPLALAVLFGAIVMPTDPVSILAVFDDLGVPERLTVLVEGESLLNDGVSIVVYAAVLGVVVEADERAVAVTDLVSPAGFLADVGVGILVALVGGAAVGAAAGSLASTLIARVDDRLTAVVVTLLVAYGVYLILDLLGSSGVIGTLTAGLVLASGHGGADISRETRYSIDVIWSYAAFVGNTVLFVAIGILIPFDLLVRNLPTILVAAVVVFLARAVVVYPLVGVLNRRLVVPIPRRYQHVLTWSGIHASVSIALVLGVAETITAPVTERLSALVFGVAAITLLVNGSTMGWVVDRLGIRTTNPRQRLYQTLVGRRNGVEAAIDTADRLLEAGDIPRRVHEDVIGAYRRERADLNAAIDALLETSPEVRRHERRIATRRVLRAEYEAIDGALQRGEVDRDVGERLLGDVERRLDRTRHEPDAAVPSPASSTDWRARLATVGLSLDVGGNADDSVSVDTDADADTDTDTDTDTTGPEDSDRSA